MTPLFVPTLALACLEIVNAELVSRACAKVGKSLDVLLALTVGSCDKVAVDRRSLRRMMRAARKGRPLSLPLSVPGHALRCGPETSVTSPLRWLWFELSEHEKTYIQSSRPWECGNPEGISKECGKGGKPASWLSMLSILCHFHGLLFARQMLY